MTDEAVFGLGEEVADALQFFFVLLLTLGHQLKGGKAQPRELVPSSLLSQLFYNNTFCKFRLHKRPYVCCKHDSSGGHTERVTQNARAWLMHMEGGHASMAPLNRTLATRMCKRWSF